MNPSDPHWLNWLSLGFGAGTVFGMWLGSIVRRAIADWQFRKYDDE